MNRFMSRRVSRPRRRARRDARVAFAGCSLNETSTRRSRIDYKSTSKLPPLDVPPDLVNPRGDDRYAIPERAQQSAPYSGLPDRARRRSVRPAEAQVLPPAPRACASSARVTQRWLVVDQPADRLWPVVREFWQESGFIAADGVARNRHHRDRVGREPREDPAGLHCGARSAPRVRLAVFDRRARQVPHAPRDRSRAAPRSTSATAA